MAPRSSVDRPPGLLPAVTLGGAAVVALLVLGGAGRLAVGVAALLALNAAALWLLWRAAVVDDEPVGVCTRRPHR